jgi:hypothetical protein
VALAFDQGQLPPLATALDHDADLGAETASRSSPRMGSDGSLARFATAFFRRVLASHSRRPIMKEPINIIDLRILRYIHFPDE